MESDVVRINPEIKECIDKDYLCFSNVSDRQHNELCVPDINRL